MVLNLKIPDDLFELYVRKYGVPQIYAAFRRALEMYKDIQEGDRIIVLAGSARQELEAVFGTTIDDAAKLTRLVKKLNTVRIGTIEHSFTDDELARLDMQATFHGRDRDTFLREMVQEIVGRMLEQI